MHAIYYLGIKVMKRVLVAAVFTIFAFLSATSVYAASAAELDANVAETIEVFKNEVNGADVFLGQAAGYLVFPRVIKVGIGLGAETGEGALVVNGRSAAYFRTTSGSFGLQLGAQAKSMVIAFMTKESLAKFRESSGWQVGVDGSVALIDLGAGKQINSGNIKDPVVGFIFGSKGLMYNLTLEGTKISRVKKD